MRNDLQPLSGPHCLVHNLWHYSLNLDNKITANECFSHPLGSSLYMYWWIMMLHSLTLWNNGAGKRTVVCQEASLRYGSTTVGSRLPATTSPSSPNYHEPLTTSLFFIYFSERQEYVIRNFQSNMSTLILHKKKIPGTEDTMKPSLRLASSLRSLYCLRWPRNRSPWEMVETFSKNFLLCRV